MTTETLTVNIIGKDQLSSPLGKMGKALMSFGGLAGGAALTGITALTKGIAAFGASSVKEGAAFTKSMSNVKALTGATATEFAKLEEQAKTLGATTKFTAIEAAEGMQFMAMAGFEVNEIMSAMPGVLDLAAASNMELGRSADIVSNVLSGFGADASETGRFVDVLTQTFTSSNTSLEQLGQAFKFVAPVAESFGFSVEETAAALGTLGNAGVQAGIAGRGLRGVMSKLGAPTNAAATAMEGLGIEIFNSAGEMKSLPEIIGSFNRATAGMTEQQKAAALGTIFSRGELSNMLILMKAGQGTLEDFGSELENSGGRAAEIAAEQLNNLSGDVTLFQSALSGVKIKVFEVLEPVLRRVVQAGTAFLTNFGPQITSAFDMIGGGINKAVEIITNAWTIFQAFGAEGAALSIMAMLGFSTDQINTVRGYIEQIKTMIGGIQTFISTAFGEGTQGVMALLGFDSEQITAFMGIVAQIKQAFTDLGVNVMNLFGIAAEGGASFNWIDLIGNALIWVNENFDMLKNIIVAVGIAFAAAGIVGAVLGIIAAINPLTLIIAAVGVAVGLLYTAWQTNFMNIQAIALTVFTVLQAIFTAFMSTITDNVIPILTESFNSLTESLASAGVSWGDIFTALGTAVTIVGAVIGAAVLLVIGVFAGLVAAGAQTVAVIIEAFTGLTSAFVSIAAGWMVLFAGVGAFFTGDFVAGWEMMKAGVIEIVKGLSTAITTIFNTLVIGVGTIIGTFIDTIVGFFESLYHTLVGGSIIPELADQATGIFETMSGSITGIFDSLVGSITSAVSSIGGAISSLGSKISGLSSQLSSLSLPSFLQSNSPTPFEIGLLGINDAMGKTQTQVRGLSMEMDKLTQPPLLDVNDSAMMQSSGLVDNSMIGSGNKESHLHIYESGANKEDLVADFGILESMNSNA